MLALSHAPALAPTLALSLPFALVSALAFAFAHPPAHPRVLALPTPPCGVLERFLLHLLLLHLCSPSAALVPPLVQP